MNKERERINKKFNNDGSITYLYQDETGDAQMTIYNISSGVKVMYHSVHADYSYLGTVKKGNVIEIHHCREGRIEHSFNDIYFYLMPGDLAVDMVKREKRKFVFPTRHYHGITISINIDLAPKCFSCFLKDVDVEPEKVGKKLCSERNCFVIRSKDYIEHLFSEMYNVPCENIKAYYKIKVLELLLVLNSINPDENRLNSYILSDSQVSLAKDVAQFISKNMDGHITVAMLTEKFHISATHLQNAFKGVFGVPVISYIRIQKMNIASLKLLKTDKTVMEIASECGYDNASKFAAAFKEIMNETPLEYRKKHRHIN